MSEYKRRAFQYAFGHGGSHPLKPPDPPPPDPEVVAKRAQYRKAEAEFYARREELREAIARAGRRAQDDE